MHNNYHVHVETTNRSFVKTSIILKDMGVENHLFMLKLYDKDLVNVDPFDPNLSSDMMAKILYEASRNYFYFIRELVRVPINGDSELSQFGLNRINLAQAWAYDNNHNFICNTVGNHGKTIGSVVRYVWEIILGATQHKVTLLNRTRDNATRSLYIFKKIVNSLPHYMVNTSTKSVDNLYSYGYPSLQNKIETKPAVRTETDAEAMGRMIIKSSILFDDFDTIQHASTILGAITLTSNHTISINTRGKLDGVDATKIWREFDRMVNIVDFSELKFYDGEFNPVPNNSLRSKSVKYEPFNLEGGLEFNTREKPTFINIKMNIFKLGGTMEVYDELCRVHMFNWRSIRMCVLLQEGDDITDQPVTPKELESFMTQ